MVKNKFKDHSWLDTLKLFNNDTQYCDTTASHKSFFDLLLTSFNIKNLSINKFEFSFLDNKQIKFVKSLDFQISKNAKITEAQSLEKFFNLEILKIDYKPLTNE